MPRISVVVPIYNVEPYLEECLESIAGQTFRDLEVVMVDDGSSDNSPAIAERFAARDERFRLLSRSRTAGSATPATPASRPPPGEFIAFVDSDDFLTANAYELLLAALDETGSDFATGNVLRLQSQGVRQSAFLADAFAKTRLSTHVSKYPPLIADRVAWNKLFRRSFWDAHGRRFPEGVLNEDIPVIVPAHFAARSVDVIADPIYYWRARDGDQLSITQRRLEPRALRDRIAAVAQVVDWLEKNGHGKWTQKYYESLVADDLRLYLNPLVDADEEYQQLFLDKVNAFLDRAPKDVFDSLSSTERLKWQLVRRRQMPELLELLRSQRERLRIRRLRSKCGSPGGYPPATAGESHEPFARSGVHKITPMPRISVVVPIYNVEPYLEECLESIAGQTFRDLEVVMVEDGSQDNSPAIAERFAARDDRFRLVTQPNGGLGSARNTGIQAATGEFLAFVDSDDYLAHNAYQLLIAALDETGSDFATGNVLRLQSQGVRQSAFLADAFAKTRLKTHVSEYPPLIADRVAWNKLFRRSFWDAHCRRFPEGVLNEDIPVMVPAHFAARSVDVIADPIIYWRARDGDQLSITQRRLEPRALRDRLAASEQVVDWLDKNGRRKWKRWYYEGLVADDLRLYLNPLWAAGTSTGRCSWTGSTPCSTARRSASSTRCRRSSG